MGQVSQQQQTSTSPRYLVYLTSRPTPRKSPLRGEAKLIRRHPLNLYAGHLDSYPGENQGGGDGDTGKDAAILYVPPTRVINRHLTGQLHDG
jgi:hypothetical protein